MNSAVIVVENGTVVIYKSDDWAKLKREVIRARKKGYPYAVLVAEAFTTV